MINYLPTLYKKTSTGAIQQWTIGVEDNTIYTVFGQLDGKLQKTQDTITQGKNIGKTNETTPEEQAKLEAQSHWDKKTKKRYVTTVEAAQAGLVDTEVITGGADPMLAHVYEKQGHKITFPAYVQPKLDGHRCVAIIKDGVCTLWSRTRRPIKTVPHIVKELESLGLPDCVLDGELYNHEYRDKFEELTSFIKRDEPKEGHEVVQYHVYDFIEDGEFEVRWFHAKRLALLSDANYVKLVATHNAKTQEQVIEFFNSCTNAGYEGAMIRNAKSPYEPKRSYNLQKIKSFDDSEYKVIGVVPGRGKLTDMGIFVCETGNGETFEAKMCGSLESLRAYLDNPKDYIGKWITIQHQGVTNSGKPRFAIALRFREDL